MKRIFLSLVVVVMAGAAAVGATKAYFSDTETSVGNTFAAGTLDLKVDGLEGTQVLHLTRTNLVPNAPWSHSYGGQWVLKNVGTVPGTFSVKVQNIQNGTTNCNGPKVAALSLYSLGPCVAPSSTGGQLGTLMYGKWSENYYGITPPRGWAGSTVFNSFNTAEGQTVNGIVLAPNEDIVAYLDLEWDTHAGTLDNSAQGDTLSFDVVFTLAQ